MNIIDQCGFKHDLEKISTSKIVCTVPSLSEYICDLGLAESLVGVTKFCIHPKSITKKIEKIGGTKNLNIEKILQLSPDIIIANKEENAKKDILALKESTNVFLTDIKNEVSAFEALSLIGKVLKKETKAKEIITVINNQKRENTVIGDAINTCYLIWKDPYMTVGNDTFIHSMMESGGLKNIFADRQRYPKVSLNQIKSLDPKLILLSSEPYPFKESHAKEIQKVVDCDIIQVDGELFSWYGSRMIFAYKYLFDLYNEINSNN